MEELTQQDIESLVEFAKDVPKIITDYSRANKIPPNQQSTIGCYFLGFQRDPVDFRLFSGDKLLLRRIASLIKDKIGPDKDYSYFQEDTSDSKSITTKTMVGTLFGETISSIKTKQNQQASELSTRNEKQ